jgi:threonine synthase
VSLRALQRCIEPNCNSAFSLNKQIYTCSACGGLLDIEIDFSEALDATLLKETWNKRLLSRDLQDRSGVWRHRELLPFADDAPIVSLFEGNTPLYDAPRSARYCGLESLLLKHQGCNPTGSFKDTGMTTAVTQARILGARLVACASTGNTAASLAAYAARAEIPCAILVPQGQISHAKLAQALDYGGIVLEILGNFDTAMHVIRELATDNGLYLANSINPFRIEGQKTVAAELMQQLDWKVPDQLVVPGGNLGNSSAFGKGFKELFDLRVIDSLPQINIIQAEGAAPFASLFSPREQYRPMSDAVSKFSPVEQPQTRATAIRIGAPVSWKKALRAVEWTSGRALAVSEQAIADAKAIIGRDGIGCEPASATTVAGIKRLVTEGLIRRDENVVAVLTGNLLKDTEYVIGYHKTRDGAEDSGLITGSYSNHPIAVEATRDAILKTLEREKQKRQLP